MDLLDLELDLRVESSSTPALTTRRSSRGAPPFTPTSTAKKSTPKTPKTPKTISKSQASVPVTPVTSKPTTANKTAIRKAEEPKIKKTPTTESVNSPQTSLAQSTDRDSRSMSLEKRSRNKVKKRFSPSPDIPSSKKRKTMTPRAVAGSTTQPDSATPRSSSVISSRPKKIKLASGVEFAHSLSELNESFQSREPEDFVLPEDLKSLGEPSETVDQIIKIGEWTFLSVVNILWKLGVCGLVLKQGIFNFLA
uniref:Uncharacterized protein n=1 Tax=Caenorhabditis japonica TaxID=281687 RepID=A0A8R1E826_CAEJA